MSVREFRVVGKLVTNGRKGSTNKSVERRVFAEEKADLFNHPESYGFSKVIKADEVR